MLAEKYPAMTEIEEIKLANELLESWYALSKKWRPRLSVPGVTVYCRQFSSSRQYDETSTLSQRWISKTQYNHVDWCVNQLPTECQICIQRTMRQRELNRQAKKEVWRVKISMSYDQVIDLILPLMRRRGLFYF